MRGIPSLNASFRFIAFGLERVGFGSVCSFSVSLFRRIVDRSIEDLICKMSSNEVVVDRIVRGFFDVEAKGCSRSDEDDVESDDGTIGSFVVPDSQCSFESSSRSGERQAGDDVQQVDLKKETRDVDGTFGKSVVLVVVLFVSSCKR